jgi:Immunity protein Imm1
MVGHDRFGVLLSYLKLAGGHGGGYCSKGDLSRLKEWVRTKHDDLMPIGLFIPFESAWRAVKEFMDTEGALPRSIEWIADEDLPNGIFPNQWEDVPFHK